MNGKTHLISDESIGGIQREYVEVERAAKAGDKIIVLFDETRRFKENEVADVEFMDGYLAYVKHAEGMRGGCAAIDYYRVLELTDIVVIGGKRYRLVDRKAEVGEKVIVVKGSGWYDNKIGSIYPVISGREYGFDSKYDLDEGEVYVENGENESGFCSFVYRKNYRVLEPITDETHIEVDGPTVDGRHASQEVIDLLANLARRVTSLETKLKYLNDKVDRSVMRLDDQLADTQGNVEKLAEDLATKTHEQSELIEMALDDIVTLDERTQPKETPFFTTYQPTFHINTTEVAEKILDEFMKAANFGGARQ